MFSLPGWWMLHCYKHPPNTVWIFTSAELILLWFLFLLFSVIEGYETILTRSYRSVCVTSLSVPSLGTVFVCRSRLFLFHSPASCTFVISVTIISCDINGRLHFRSDDSSCEEAETGISWPLCHCRLVSPTATQTTASGGCADALEVMLMWNLNYISLLARSSPPPLLLLLWIWA